MAESLFTGTLFFVSGAFVILAIVGTVYLISWCYDRSSGEDLLTPNEVEERRVAPALIRQAGLAGLLKDEQKKVVKFHFEVSSFPYVNFHNIQAHKATGNDTSKVETQSSTGDGAEEIAINSTDTFEVTDKQFEEIEDGQDDYEEPSDDIDKEEPAESSTTEAEENATFDLEKGINKNNGQESTNKVGKSDEEESPEIADTSAAQQDDGDKDENADEEDEKKNSHESGSKKTAKCHQHEDVEEEEGVCSICLEEGEKVVIGSTCGHMFHLSCFMKWVEKKHLDCPICRSDMISADEFLASAYQVLGDERVNKIRSINEEAAKRLEEWSRKHAMQEQQQQAAAAEASSGEPASTSEAGTDIEEGEAQQADTESKPEDETNLEPNSEVEAEAKLEQAEAESYEEEESKSVTDKTITCH